MIGALVLLSLQVGNPYNWQMDCQQFLEAKQRVLSDIHLDNESRSHLIRYFRSKLNEPCNQVFADTRKCFDSLSSYS